MTDIKKLEAAYIEAVNNQCLISRPSPCTSCKAIEALKNK
jgi:hypothetical protein